MTDLPPDPFEPTEEILLVLIGRKLKLNSEFATFLIVTRDQFAEGHLTGGEKEVSYPRNNSLLRRINAIPGMVYSFHVSWDAGLPILKIATAHYEGLWPDRSMRALWQEQDRLVNLKKELRLEERRDNKDKALFDTLKTARQIYGSLPEFDRALFIARVVRYIVLGQIDSKSQDK